MNLKDKRTERRKPMFTREKNCRGRTKKGFKTRVYFLFFLSVKGLGSCVPKKYSMPPGRRMSKDRKTPVFA